MNDSYGTGNVNDRYGTGNMNDRYGTGNVNDRYGTGNVNDRYGTGNGNGSYGTGDGKNVIAYSQSSSDYRVGADPSTWPQHPVKSYKVLQYFIQLSPTDLDV